MFGYVGYEIEYQCQFPPGKAGLLGLVGYQIKSAGVVVVPRTTAGIFENGFGSYGMKLTHLVPVSGSITWDTGDADIKRASEEINIIVTAPVDVDLSPVLAELNSPDYGLAANMMLLEEAAAEVDIIHAALGDLGAALSAGLATEITQQAILNKLTIPDDDRPVAPVPAAPRPGLQALYGSAGSPDGLPLANIVVSAELVGSNRVANEFLIHQQLTGASDDNGNWSLILVQGCKYRITIPEHDEIYQLTITDATTATLASYLEVA